MRRTSTLALSALMWFGCNEPDSGDDGPSSDAGATLDAAATNDAGSSDGGVTADAGSESASCPAGATLLRYSFSPVDPLPSLAMIPLPNLIANTQITSAGNGIEHSVRFDICDNAGDRRLMSVLVRENSVSAATLYRRDDTVTAATEEIVEIEEGWVFLRRLPPSAFSVEGLEAALDGDLAALHIRFMIEYGMVIAGSEGFLSLATGRVGPTTIDYGSILVIVGGLVEGDVFAGLECRFGEEPFSTSFTMATATFEVEACRFLGEGITTGYRINSLAVQDSSPELSAAERERFTFTTDAEVRSVMNYVYNHHNACDSFHLALPHADYAATSAATAGCGEEVDNAPDREFQDPDQSVLFRIRYHGGDWVDGSMPGCSHYLFCN